MVGIVVDPGRTAVPEPLRGRYTVARGLFRQQYNRVKLGEMSQLWPFDGLRKEAIRAARLFTEHLAKQGYDLLTPEMDIVLIGPYQTRTYTHDLSANPRVVGSSANEAYESDAADFVLEALFLNRRHRPVQVAS